MRIVHLTFVLLLTSCATPPPIDPGPSHPGDAWFAFRAGQLGVSAGEARKRDAALSTETPAPTRADPEMQREARALWRDLCARCHGSQGRLEDSDPLPEGQTPPRDWGSAGSGFAFWMAGDGFRATVYRRIAKGGDREGNPTTMPAWEEPLSREQIWALVELIERF